MQNMADSVSKAVQKADKASLADFLGGRSTSSAASSLKVCIMTADFWGLKSAGGTATAYHLLAELLAQNPTLSVSSHSYLKVYNVTSIKHKQYWLS